MMDGYSVTEAASVLGVPTERVWELLARGVLAGRPEGESGMRVFLQPRAPLAPPPAPTAARDEPSPGNGSERAELSPFRELLTEFRNLTERYGQALLALGEARGEVASLRSRVDLLEARMDLRLPMGEAAGPAAWAAPAYTPEAPSVPPIAEPDVEEAHRTRRRGPRRATESFAEALGRAEDPSVPDLLGGADRAAVAATVEPVAGAPAEPSLPREVAPAEAVPVADEPSARVVEREREAAEQSVADVEDSAGQAATEEPAAAEAENGDAAEPDAGTALTDESAESGDEGPAAGGEPWTQRAAEELAPEPSVGWPASEQSTATPEEGIGLEREEAAASAEAPELHAAAPEEAPGEAAPEEAVPEAERPEEQAVGRAVATVDAEGDIGAREEAPASIDFDERRYTTAIEEPDWFAAEVEPEPSPDAAPPEASRAEIAEAADADDAAADADDAAADADDAAADADDAAADADDAAADADEPPPDVVEPAPDAGGATPAREVGGDATEEPEAGAMEEAADETATEAAEEAADEAAARIEDAFEPKPPTAEEPEGGGETVGAGTPDRSDPEDVARAIATPGAATPEGTGGRTGEVRGTASPADDEETMLWFGRGSEPPGADEIEVVGHGSEPAGGSTSRGTLPGAAELDRELTALAESRREAPDTSSEVSWPPPAPNAGPRYPTVQRASVPSLHDATRHRPVMPAGPATRAYRRLRRIFPD